MDSPHIRKLVEEALDLHAEGGDEALEEWLQRHRADERAVRERLAVLMDSGLFASEGPPVLEGRFGDFSILEELGRGGMGVVYRAHQVSLGRDVALKVLRPEQALVDKTRRRFEREVETIACLHHHGIVPVYAVGCEKGISWFAMEWVRGLTVAQALGALADRDLETMAGRDLAKVVAAAVDGEEAEGALDAPLFRGSWEQVCLRIVRHVALALDHAHRHGVIHRDVKPSNIMLTPQGRVQLVDFGVSASFEAEDAERMTKTGAFLGTLGYMSPEQLRGDVDALDARTDVFSLGITLHEMLALEPAFQGTPHTILKQVSEGRRSRVRDRLHSVSWEAETILMAATDPDARRRYPSASHMARDIEAALEHRPILARRPPRVVRIRRWMQRHPARAVSLVVAVLALVVGPMTYGFVQRSHRIKVQAALDESERQRRRAESNLDASRATLGLVSGIVEKMDVPSLKAERSRVLHRILDFYETYLEQRSDDVAMRLEGAVARLAAGGIRGALGDRAAMLEEQTAAITELSALVRERPDDPRARFELVFALRNHAWQLFLLGDAPGAIPWVREALDLSKSWSAPDAVRKNRLARARLLFVAGEVRRTTGDRDGAMQGFAQAIATYRSCLSQGDEAEDVTVDLSRALNERAWLLAEGGALSSALDDLDGAVSALKDLMARSPTAERHRSTLVRVLTDRGLLFARSKKWEAARKSHEEAIALSRQLMSEAPLSPVHGTNLAGGLQNLSSVLKNMGRNREARELLSEGKDILDGMHQRDPGDRSVRFRLAAAYGRLGNLARSEKDFAEAGRCYREGIAHVDANLAANPREPSWLKRRYQLTRLLAEVLNAQGDYEGIVESVKGLLASGRYGLSTHLWCAAILADAMLRAGRDEGLTREERVRREGVYRGLAWGALESCPVMRAADLKMVEEAAGLDALRSDPRFATVMERLRARAARNSRKP